MARMTMFIDTSKCTACRGCQTACKSWNELPAEILEFKGFLQTHTDTSHQTFTYVDMRERLRQGKMEWFFLKRQCMHCTEAACIEVCPENAVYRTEQGVVAVDNDRCIGCGYCAQYCPFGIPKINEKDHKMYKCHLCSDRISNNLKPACAKTCPPGAVQFGERAKLLSEAEARLLEVKREYPNANLYGLDNQFLGGTNVVFLLQEEPEFYGLKAKPVIPPVVGLWQGFIQPMGKLLPIGVLGAIFASVVSNRLVNKDANKNHQTQEKGGE